METSVIKLYETRGGEFVSFDIKGAPKHHEPTFGERGLVEAPIFYFYIERSDVNVKLLEKMYEKNIYCEVFFDSGETIHFNGKLEGFHKNNEHLVLHLYWGDDSENLFEQLENIL